MVQGYREGMYDTSLDTRKHLVRGSDQPFTGSGSSRESRKPQDNAIPVWEDGILRQELRDDTKIEVPVERRILSGKNRRSERQERTATPQETRVSNAIDGKPEFRVGVNRSAARKDRSAARRSPRERQEPIES